MAMYGKTVYGIKDKIIKRLIRIKVGIIALSDATGKSNKEVYFQWIKELDAIQEKIENYEIIED